MFFFTVSDRAISLHSITRNGGAYNRSSHPPHHRDRASADSLFKNMKKLAATAPECSGKTLRSRRDLLSGDPVFLSYERTVPLAVFVAGTTHDISLEHAVRALYGTPVLVDGTFTADVSSLETLLRTLVRKQPSFIMIPSGSDEETESSRHFNAIMEIVLFYKKHIRPDTVILSIGHHEPHSPLKKQLVSTGQYYHAPIGTDTENRYSAIRDVIMSIYTDYCLPDFSDEERDAFTPVGTNISRAIHMLTGTYRKNILSYRQSGRSSFLSGAWLNENTVQTRHRMFSPLWHDIRRTFRQKHGPDAPLLTERLLSTIRESSSVASDSDPLIFGYFLGNTAGRFFFKNRSRDSFRRRNDLATVLFDSGSTQEDRIDFSEIIISIPPDHSALESEDILSIVADRFNSRGTVKVVLDHDNILDHIGALLAVNPTPPRNLMHTFTGSLKIIGYIIRPAPVAGLSGPLTVRIKDAKQEMSHRMNRGEHHLFPVSGDVVADVVPHSPLSFLHGKRAVEHTEFTSDNAHILVDNR